MSEFQKLVATSALTSTVMIFDDSEHGSGQRKRDAGNTRRVALHRVLNREHKREMRDAINGAPVDIINENCSECGSSTSTCSCCEECGRSSCDCDSSLHDILERIAAGPQLVDVAVDLSRALRRVSLVSTELDLYDFYWKNFETNKENDMPSTTRTTAFDNSIFDAPSVNDGDDYSFADSFADELFASHRDDATLFEAPSLRRKFFALPGGRTKRAKNRFDNYYGNSHFHPSKGRTKGFSDAAVIEFLDEAADLAFEKARKERLRVELEARLEAERAQSANRGNRSSRRGKRKGNRAPAPVVEVITKGRNDFGRRLPPGYVMKTETGKLVWVAYEQLLAA